MKELEQIIKTDDILSEQDIEFFKLKRVNFFADGYIYQDKYNTYLLDPIKEQRDLYKVWFQYKR